jgi:hypothetical protein
MLRQIGLTVAGSLALAGLTVAPAFASSGPSPYTNGELVRFQGQPQVYQVIATSTGPVLGWISSSAVFNANGYQWSQVHVLPNGIPRPPDNDWLAPQYAAGAGGWQSGVIPSPASIPVTESMPGSGLIRYPGQSAVYLITHGPRGHDGRIRWIPSSAVFNAAGYSWSQVRTVPSAWLVKPGTPMILFRVTGTTKVYAFLNGSLHWIPSSHDFTTWGYNWQSVLPVHYLPYPIGSPLTITPQ